MDSCSDIGFFNIFTIIFLLQDYVSDFVKVGGVQKLQDGEFIVQVSLVVSHHSIY
jgi:hypothetical protein